MLIQYILIQVDPYVHPTPYDEISQINNNNFFCSTFFCNPSKIFKFTTLGVNHV